MRIPKIIDFKYLTVNRNRVILFFCLMVFLIGLDLLTKEIIERNLLREVDFHTWRRLPIGQHGPRENNKFFHAKEVTVIPNFWSWSYVRNKDIGFSALSFLDKFLKEDAKRRVLQMLQLCAVLLALVYFFHNKMDYFLPFLLIISGGFGNALNRLIKGYVIDFIKWYIPGFPIKLFDPWPYFNLADTFIVVGGFLLIYFLIREWWLKKKAGRPQPADK